MARPAISLIGPGRLGESLACSLRAAGYPIAEIVYRKGGASADSARALARKLHTRATTTPSLADVVLLCVGDSQLPRAAEEFAALTWRGRVALHTSGALGSDVLAPLKRRGAAVGSMHPMMSFVRGVRTPLRNVTFALEGDARALRVARQIAHDLGGVSFVLDKKSKPLYHAFGGFTSPLLIATLAAGESVARAAGLSERQARNAMRPIVEQTLRNFFEKGAAAAFSGPLVRGDLDTIRKHLAVLRAVPEARSAYMALVRSALKTLPVKNSAAIKKLLDAGSSRRSSRR